MLVDAARRLYKPIENNDLETMEALYAESAILVWMCVRTDQVWTLSSIRVRTRRLLGLPMASSGGD